MGLGESLRAPGAGAACFRRLESVERRGMEARAAGVVPRFVGFLYTLAKLVPVERFTERRWNGVECLISAREQPTVPLRARVLYARVGCCDSPPATGDIAGDHRACLLLSRPDRKKANFMPVRCPGLSDKVGSFSDRNWNRY